MGHGGRRHWRHNGAHIKVRSALGAGNALVGAAIAHKDERRGDRKLMLKPYENIDENTAAVVKVDERGRFLEGSNLKVLRARQAQEGSGDPPVVVATVIHVVLENGSTVGKFTVPTLPATVSNSDLGRVTIPAENDSAVVAPTAPPNNSQLPVPPAPGPGPVPSDPNASTPGNGPGAPPEPTPSDSTVNPRPDPTSPIPDPSTATSELPQPTTDIASTSSTSASGSSNVPPPASSPASPPSSASTSASASKNVTPPTFIVLPISSNSTSMVSTSANAPIGLVPTEPGRLFPTTASDATTSSTLPPSLPSSSALLTSTPSTSTSTSSLSSLAATSSTASTQLSTTRSSKSALGPTYASGFGDGRGGGGGAGGGSGYPTATGPAGGIPAGSSGSPPVPTSKVVGGVVGGVAGVVLLIVVALLLLRTRKRKGDPSRGLTAEDQGTAAILHTGVAGAMTERSASTATRGSALGGAAIFSKWRNSHQSTRTLEPPTSERGFQKVSGRKITSVLESGGDGYDDPFGATGEKLYHETTSTAAASNEPGSPIMITPIIPASSSSFQARPAISRNGTSRNAGPIAQPLPAPPLGRPPSQESDSSAQVVLRPSPARTPLTSSVDVTTTTTLATSGSIALHPPPNESLPRLPIHRRVSGQDAIGRSMASSDGSRASRFTEGI